MGPASFRAVRKRGSQRGQRQIEGFGVNGGVRPGVTEDGRSTLRNSEFQQTRESKSFGKAIQVITTEWTIL